MTQEETQEETQQHWEDVVSDEEGEAQTSGTMNSTAICLGVGAYYAGADGSIASTNT